ncbi:MAG: hypothetical protein LC105_08725 [Chitinophagales bacterium]|nr:hypothetical protein [Chitinophagales bacterium]
MIKKNSILFSMMLVVAIACRKESICANQGNYVVHQFSFQINSVNRGLFKEEGRNTATTIGSIRNQFLFIPEKSFMASSVNRTIGFDIFPSAYARDCIEVERSLTSFDASKTTLTIDRDLDLSIFGLSGVILKGQNLLDNSELKSKYLKDITSNIDMHAGIEIPVSLSIDFLRILDGEKINFTLGLVSTTGDKMESSVEAVIDVTV